MAKNTKVFIPESVMLDPTCSGTPLDPQPDLTAHCTTPVKRARSRFLLLTMNTVSTARVRGKISLAQTRSTRAGA
jgi:hypothetical protein